LLLHPGIPLVLNCCWGAPRQIFAANTSLNEGSLTGWFAELPITGRSPGLLVQQMNPGGMKTELENAAVVP
jgi:hypothetical protein